MELPDREQVIPILMDIYQWTFHLVFIVAVFTVLNILWHLFPRKEY